MSDLPDDIIMTSVKQGDLSGMATLFERYHVRMYRFFLRLTLDKSASEDLTQNLFYRILKYRQSYQQGEGHFKSWIYQMARNIHYDFCKGKDKATKKNQSLQLVENYFSMPETTGHDADIDKLYLALNRLAPEQREMIVLSRFQGLKYQEIAELTSVSVPAIKVRIHRALKELKDLYFKQP
jgi:RNA polymerase sigma factor (sigma-70 family)